MPTLKQKLRDNRLVVGTILSEVRNPNVAFMLAQCGFEFFIIDNEHGSYSSETICNMIAAARGAGIAVLVRVPEIRRETILKPLDAGAEGLLVPQVNSPAEAEEVVRHAKYPPLGNRGIGLRRAHSRYARINPAEYLAQANAEMFLAVQPETVEGIRMADQIAAVEGIDCLFAGPMDLSVSLGIPGQFNHPQEVEAIDVMIEASRKHGNASGILLVDTTALKPWIDKGMRFIAYSSDITLLADAAAKGVQELRGYVGE